MIHEYAFDVELASVIRVEADSEAEARELLLKAVQCVEVVHECDSRINSVLITEVSAGHIYPHLFEIDGKSTEGA